MRISHWSSDLCSSDLTGAQAYFNAGLLFDSPANQESATQSLCRRLCRFHNHAIHVLYCRFAETFFWPRQRNRTTELILCTEHGTSHGKIGKASCSERVCKSV